MRWEYVLLLVRICNSSCTLASFPIQSNSIWTI
jgi:hypothetical protein